MNKFKKLTVAAAVSAVVGGVAAPSAQAQILGVPGEALLVPFVLYSGAFGAETVNTYIGITAPSAVYKDDVWNKYTAPNTTSSGSYTMPPVVAPGVPDPYDAVDPVGLAAHWFFFSANSDHQLDGRFSLSPDDLDVLDWSAVAQGGTQNGTIAARVAATPTAAGALQNVPGYLVITTEVARSGAAANFVMMADAAMQFGVLNTNERFVTIPVMALADGDDSLYPAAPRLGNEVIWSSNLPKTVSPVVTGIRMNNGTGTLDGVDVLWDLAIGGRSISDALHVIWLDRCGNGGSGPTCASGGRTAQVDVFDANENQCSSTIDIGMELNLILIDTAGGPAAGHSVNLTQPNPLDPANPPTTVPPRVFCNPTGTEWWPNSTSLAILGPNGTGAEPGYAMYTVNEIGDSLTTAVDSGAVAFALNAGVRATPAANGFGRALNAGVYRIGAGTIGAWGPTGTAGIIMTLAHERGKKK